MENSNNSHNDVEFKKCGLCENFEKNFCKLHKLKVKPFEKYKCKNYKNNKNVSTANVDKKSQQIQYPPLHERDLSVYDFKLPILSRLLIKLKRSKINPYILFLVIGLGLTLLNYYFSTLVSTDEIIFTYGVFFANLFLIFTPLLFYYGMRKILDIFEDLEQILSIELLLR